MTNDLGDDAQLNPVPEGAAKQNNEDEEDSSSKKGQKTPQEIEQLHVEEDRTRLKSKGIECYDMCWEDYLRSEHKDTDERFDLFISQPPRAPSRSWIHSIRHKVKCKEEISQEEVKKVPQSLKRILKPGGYVLLIIPFYSFLEWYESLYSAGYEIFEEPYVLSYDTNTIQKRHGRYFPQVSHECVLIARLSSSTDGILSPHFDSSFSLVGCTSSRNSSVMFNVSKQKSLLCKHGTKIPFHPNKLSPFMLSELIDL